ncbi:M20 peptidase aminoacylase family protein [Bacillus taeanensis]|uniref:Amidohydrolase n=1 Tax=Bacillus taeanensis TaxID=273032 RepID=A0A366Y0C8_9BACI|nr:M20 peptidase aminoacylase family protein [Bacillus taeanensis]RBW69853.1 amidohydrolase [Bacillus taeanensis]
MKAAVEKLKPILGTLFQHLHTHPEVSWKEVNTTSYLMNFLKKYEFEPKPFEDSTGFTVEVGEGDFCVGLRTDIDALWQEINGEFQANHSCGHDAHMTMIIGTMLLLKELKFKPNGKIKVIFQPAEEKGTGALKLIEKGVVDDVNYLYGVHLRPIQELRDGEACAGIQHGAAAFLSGTIKGEDAHAARSHLGTNAIEVGAALVHHLSTIHLDPMIPHSVKMTAFHAGGESGNIIPGSASFKLDLRAQRNETMKNLQAQVYQIVNKLSELYNVEITLRGADGTAAAIIDPTAQSFMEKAIVDTIGPNYLSPSVVTSGGEDFHFYTLKRPHLKAVMLGLGCDLKPGLHHPNMTFNREALFIGIEILAKTIIHTFDEYKKEEAGTKP